MSFLNDLKKQADQLRADHGVDKAAVQAKVDATEQACQAAFKYWDDLCRQLTVIAPVSRGRLVLDGKVAFEGLPLRNFRADIRKRPFPLTGQQVTDHVALYCDLGTGQAVSLAKNFPLDMERLESRLAQAGIQCIPEPVRNPDNGKLIEVRYAFEANMRAGVLLQPDHEKAQVRFTVDNLEGLVRWVIAFDARDVTPGLLDELAKWLVGQPNDFARRGQVLQLREC